MSNKLEILEEYREATHELAELQDESSASTHRMASHDQIESLRGQCDQLDAILEAMDAAED